MSFPTYLFSSPQASVPPAKNAAEVLNNTLAPDGVKKPFSVLDKLVFRKPPADASKEKSLKKIEKKRRKIEFAAVAGMLIVAVFAIYRREAIQKLFSDKQPLKPIVPTPVATAVIKPHPSSPFTAETIKTANS